MFRIIPEQVFTFPISVFTALSTLFICGGFISVDMFTSPLKEIVQFIPFTYSYTVTFNTLLTGDPISLFNLLGLIFYIILFLIISMKFYQKFIISKN